MTNKTKLFLFIFLFLSFTVGLTIGILWKDFPFITFNPELKIYEIINILLTIGIGIFIPMLLKKWIEDNRSIKSFLVDEIRIIINSIDKINCKIKDTYEVGAISQPEKDEINYLFHTAEIQISSFKEQLEVAFSNQERRLYPLLSSCYNSYKDFLTGGSLMISTFNKIDDSFYREHNQKYLKLTSHLKTLIQQIYKF